MSISRDDLAPAEAADIIAREKAYSQELQRSGKWRHIWRIVGEYANYSVFDVEDNDELHEILSGLPLFKFMTIDGDAAAAASVIDPRRRRLTSPQARNREDGDPHESTFNATQEEE